MAPARPRKLRVGALERESGLTRDIIHHYVKLGLIPPPEKSNATVSWYGDLHLAALQRVRAMKARGLSLTEIKRALDRDDAPTGLADLDAAAALLASRERPSVAREQLPPERRALLDALEMPDDALVTASLADALARLARGPSPERARARLTACAEAVRQSAELIHRAVLDALTASDAPVRDALDAASAVRDALDAWRAHREQSLLTSMLREVTATARTAQRAPWRSPAPAVTEGATLRLVVLERAIEASPDDAALHAERARLLLGASSSRRAGDAAREALSRGLDDPWVHLAAGVAALDGDACEEALAHLRRALARRPAWGLAEAFACAASLYGAARAGDGLAAAASAIGRLDAIAPHADDPLAARLRTRLVTAQTQLALPARFERRRAAVATLRQLLAEAHAVPPDDVTRGTGELARLEGNAWLTLGDACARDGDPAAADDAWTRSLAAGGRIAWAARAKLRGAAR